MERALIRKSLVLCSVVAEEILTGARTQNERQTYHVFFALIRRLGRIATPDDAAWLSCGRILSRYRERYGEIKSRDHQNDILILLVALRLAQQEETTLVTENDADFATWLGFVHDQSRLRVEAVRR